MEDKQKELAGLIKEMTDESVSPISKDIEEMKVKAAEQAETNGNQNCWNSTVCSQGV